MITFMPISKIIVGLTSSCPPGVMRAAHEPSQPADLIAHPGHPSRGWEFLCVGRLRPLVRLCAVFGSGCDRLVGWAHGEALAAAVRDRPLSGPDRRQAAGCGDIVHADHVRAALCACGAAGT